MRLSIVGVVLWTAAGLGAVVAVTLGSYAAIPLLGVAVWRAVAHIEEIDAARAKRKQQSP